MDRSIRRGWVVPRAMVFVVLVSIALAPPGSATEPDGHLELRTEWLQKNADRDPLVVRLSIRSLVALDDATLTITTPFDLGIRPLAPIAEGEFVIVPAVQDRYAIRAGLRPLDTTVPSTVDFELILPPAGYGILEFIVEGRDSSGRIVRNAIGLAAGESPPTSVRRLGAIEFPATVLPAEKN